MFKWFLVLLSQINRPSATPKTFKIKLGWVIVCNNSSLNRLGVSYRCKGLTKSSRLIRLDVSNSPFSAVNACGVNLGCRIHWLHLCRRVSLLKRVYWYDTKQSEDDASVMLELWGMWSAPLLPSLPGPLWPVVVAPHRVLCMG